MPQRLILRALENTRVGENRGEILRRKAHVTVLSRVTSGQPTVGTASRWRGQGGREAFRLNRWKSFSSSWFSSPRNQMGTSVVRAAGSGGDRKGGLGGYVW